LALIVGLKREGGNGGEPTKRRTQHAKKNREWRGNGTLSKRGKTKETAVRMNERGTGKWEGGDGEYEERGMGSRYTCVEGYQKGKKGFGR